MNGSQNTDRPLPNDKQDLQWQALNKRLSYPHDNELPCPISHQERRDLQHCGNESNITLSLQKKPEFGPKKHLGYNSKYQSADAIKLKANYGDQKLHSNYGGEGCIRNSQDVLEEEICTGVITERTSEPSPVEAGDKAQIEMKVANSGPVETSGTAVEQLSMEQNDHEDRKDWSVALVRFTQPDGKHKWAIMLIKNDHKQGKRTETVCYQCSMPLEQLVRLLGGDLLFLEHGKIEDTKAGKMQSVSLKMITKSRTAMQCLMLFKCPVLEDNTTKPVRMFISNTKAALGILKLGNNLRVLTGLGMDGYAKNLPNNYLDVQFDKTLEILELAIVEHQFLDPLDPYFIYIGSISANWKFSEIICDKTTKQVVRKLNIQFGNLETVKGGKLIGMHYSPFLKDFDNYPELCRVTLFVDLGDRISINVVIVSRDMGVNKSECKYQGQFTLEKSKYGLEGQVSMSYQEDPYNQLKVFLVCKRLEALACVDITYKAADVLVTAQKIQISKGGASKVHEVDWLEPSALQTVSGLMTMICDNNRTAVHIRRVIGPACLEDIIPPRITHLDTLLAEQPL